MKKVIFVGDRPSKRNLDPNLAFIGTQSFINLHKWIIKMKISDFIMVNSYCYEDLVKICQFINAGNDTFIALGNDASFRLQKLSVQHYKLPHPSPRNRKLNNKEYIDSELQKCYKYIMERRNVCNL